MKKITLALLSLSLLCACSSNTVTAPETITMEKTELMDKIKGGWAGQTIGCTYGGPTEFRYCSQMINPNYNIEWPEGYIKWYFDNFPGLYDDIYMDLTFVDVFDKEGLDAPVSSFAESFANAGYQLWHANMQARYNILNDIPAPQSGYWETNPHADDIDFQIEADYAGLMAPGMVNAAVHYTDEIGHIMNYGDGWYGGVYVAAMYSLAFVYDDIETIVKEALKVIPEQSRYYRCMSDVIRWHEQYPEDWQIAWALCEKEHSFDIGCPDGVFKPFNIDAVINSAYILIGLLYGEGDFYRTMDISTRCGQDSDCNPASACGILGTMLGYDNIPEYWKKNLHEVEDLPFAYTDISLNKTYQMSFDQALQVIGLNGGNTEGDAVTIKVQTPETVRFEQSFAGHYPQYSKEVPDTEVDGAELTFNGNGVVVGYSMVPAGADPYARRRREISDRDYVARVEVSIDGKAVETVSLPAWHHVAKPEMFYRYNLPVAEHKVSFKWLNPRKDISLTVGNMTVYSDKPLTIKHQ